MMAQQAQTPDPAAASTPQKLTKEQKKKMGRALKELDAQYKQWLSEDVIYIISPEERTAFLAMSTSEEREQFIEQFWLRRSSNPDLPENDFKEEPIAASLMRMNTTLRVFLDGGQIAGVPTSFGGQRTKSIPIRRVEPTIVRWTRARFDHHLSVETWRYRYLEGIGENVIIEIRGSDRLREYSHDDGSFGKRRADTVPGAGLSLMESMGMASKRTVSRARTARICRHPWADSRRA